MDFSTNPYHVDRQKYAPTPKDINKTKSNKVLAFGTNLATDYLSN